MIILKKLQKSVISILFLFSIFCFDLNSQQNDNNQDSDNTSQDNQNSKQDEDKDGYILWKERKYEQSIAKLKEEIVAFPQRIDIYVIMGWDYLALRQYSNALDISKKGLAISPNDSRLHLNLGETYFNLRQYNPSVYHLQKYLAANPQSYKKAYIYFLMGLAYYRLKHYHLADISLSTAIYYKPNSARYITQLGLIKEKLNENKKALTFFEKALILNPGNLDALNGKKRVENITIQ